MIDKFFEEINKERHIDDTLDYIFDTLDNLLLDGQFDTCDEILDKFVVEDYDETILVGVLTIVYVWKEKLKNHKDFCDRVSKIVNDNITDGLF